MVRRYYCQTLSPVNLQRQCSVGERFENRDRVIPCSSPKRRSTGALQDASDNRARPMTATFGVRRYHAPLLILRCPANKSQCCVTQSAYVPTRRNMKVVSGFTISPFTSSKGYARKLIGPLWGSGSTSRSRPFVSSKRFAGLWPK
jgi:hypothetical protein